MESDFSNPKGWRIKYKNDIAWLKYDKYDLHIESIAHAYNNEFIL